MSLYVIREVICSSDSDMCSGIKYSYTTSTVQNLKSFRELELEVLMIFLERIRTM